MNFSQKNIFVTFLFILFIPSITLSKEENFNLWLNKLKDEAIEKGISKETVIKTINKIEILPNIINKDRQQPEFIDNFSDKFLGPHPKSTINSFSCKSILLLIK